MAGSSVLLLVAGLGLALGAAPSELRVFDVAETDASVSWIVDEEERGRRPETIEGVEVVATVLSTPAAAGEGPTTGPLEWRFSNNTRRARLSGLLPGTEYALTVRALTARGPGEAARARFETVIGEPDPPPPAPTVLERRGDRMRVRIHPALNRRGPVTRYRVVVADEERQRGFVPELLGSYDEAAKNGLPFYIAAEIDPREAREDFIVGDGKTYDGYLNAPLRRTRDVRVSVGVVSSKNGVTKVRYAEARDAILFDVDLADEPPSPAVMLLGVSVAIGAVLLIGAIGAAIVLRRRGRKARRARLARSIAMGARGRASHEIENAGFLPDDCDADDDERASGDKPWIIPRNFLEVDAATTVARGDFGRFVRCRVRRGATTVRCVAQEIPRGARCEAELEASARASGHAHVLALVGACELPDVLYAAFEEVDGTLKQFLLASRASDRAGGKFCTLDEAKIFQTALELARATTFLANKKIPPGRLCCRAVLMRGATPKLAGFGLARARPDGEPEPDLARWTARELPDGAAAAGRSTPKGDVWAFGCLLWELLALGGTPYAQVAAAEQVRARVARGLRPAQMAYVADELYQACLGCWEHDPDERPTFPRLLFDLEALLERNVLALLSFARFDGFDYEPYRAELELVAQS